MRISLSCRYIFVCIKGRIRRASKTGRHKKDRRAGKAERARDAGRASPALIPAREYTFWNHPLNPPPGGEETTRPSSSM
jgi:hypothetical protein